MNVITPVSEDSVEMQTVRLLAGPDGAHVFKFTTTDRYTGLKLYISEYQSGKLISKDCKELGFDSMGSPRFGEFLIVPDFEDFLVKIIISTEGAKLSNEIPILTNVEDREYYGRSATRIESETELISNNDYMYLFSFEFCKE